MSAAPSIVRAVLVEHGADPTTPDGLAWILGDEMRHCVAGYAGAVQSGRSVIVGLQAPDGTRSTVELDRATRVVVQHRSWRNSAPSEACERLLASMLVAWRGWS